MHYFFKKLVVIAMFVISVNSWAVPVLDQSYDQNLWGGGQSGALIYDTRSVGQSFTAGQSGVLSQIDLNFYHMNGNNLVQLSLVSLDDVGAPDLFDKLITTTISGIATGYANRAYHSVDFSGFDFWINAGEQYAIIMETTGDSTFVVTGGLHYEDGLTFNGPGYLGGSAWLHDAAWANSYQNRNYSIDLNFKTFIDVVDVSEPPIFSLVLAVFSVLAIRRRKVQAL